DSLEASQQQVDTEVGSFVLLSPGERAVNAKTKHAAGQISDADFIERVRKALIEAVPNPTSSISSNYDLLTSSDVEASRSPRLDSAEFEHKE
ncbi:MAG TPA: hypothetical protein VLF61_00005, partial [Rhabdochlamydiaceae bacterium]|nr:hypothetical protein [Rhabdochlamydiaceae bacterium]